ncbi:hypothetical protein [Pyrobaculum islandicum]|nr:hypothetical protein [Pyrobaculum islandicum]
MDFRHIFAERVSFVYGASGTDKTVLISKVAFDFAKAGRRVV